MLATAEEMATADLSLEEISVPLQKLRGQVEVLSVPLAELPEDGATWGDAEALVDLAEAWNNSQPSSHILVVSTRYISRPNKPRADT